MPFWLTPSGVRPLWAVSSGHTGKVRRDRHCCHGCHACTRMAEGNQAQQHPQNPQPLCSRSAGAWSRQAGGQAGQLLHRCPQFTCSPATCCLHCALQCIHVHVMFILHTYLQCSAVLCMCWLIAGTPQLLGEEIKIKIKITIKKEAGEEGRRENATTDHGPKLGSTIAVEELQMWRTDARVACPVPVVGQGAPPGCGLRQWSFHSSCPCVTVAGCRGFRVPFFGTAITTMSKVSPPSTASSPC